MFSNAAIDLNMINWDILQRRDFRMDPNDLAKFECYQAETLIRDYVPVDALSGIVCFDDASKKVVEAYVAAAGSNVKVAAYPRWYFS